MAFARTLKQTLYTFTGGCYLILHFFAVALTRKLQQSVVLQKPAYSEENQCLKLVVLRTNIHQTRSRLNETHTMILELNIYFNNTIHPVLWDKIDLLT